MHSSAFPFPFFPLRCSIVVAVEEEHEIETAMFVSLQLLWRSMQDKRHVVVPSIDTIGADDRGLGDRFVDVKVKS